MPIFYAEVFDLIKGDLSSAQHFVRDQTISMDPGFDVHQKRAKKIEQPGGNEDGPGSGFGA